MKNDEPEEKEKTNKNEPVNDSQKNSVNVEEVKQSDNNNPSDSHLKDIDTSKLELLHLLLLQREQILRYKELSLQQDSRIADQERKIATLGDEIGELKEENDKLVKKNDKLTKENDELKRLNQSKNEDNIRKKIEANDAIISKQFDLLFGGSESLLNLNNKGDKANSLLKVKEGANIDQCQKK